jgi:GT2 family glycosyltransferase
MHILVININNLQYLKNLIQDLRKQTHPFKLTVVDQGSVEKGTYQYLRKIMSISSSNVILNEKNININKIWNNFYKNSTDELLCFLNNDIRVPTNFVSDTISIFLKEPLVGAVVHATNHPDYKRTSRLKYVVLNDEFAQGWDFTMLRSVYTPIPEELDTFGGDDWLYLNMYEKGYKTAVALSSPIIHYCAQSRKYFTGNKSAVTDIYYSKYSNKRLPHYNKKYCRRKPTFFKIIEKKESIKNGG